MAKRKIVGYIDEEDYRLLELNNILKQGRDSQFSGWLRRKVQEEFGELEHLDQELLETESEIKKVESELLNLKALHQNKVKNQVRLQTLIQDKLERKKKLEKYAISKNEVDYLKDIKIGIKIHNSSHRALIYKLRAYNDTFNKRVSFDEFMQLIDNI